MLERTYHRHGLWPKTLAAEYRACRLSILDTRDSILDTRRLKTKGYVISQRVRKRIEELLGWCKTVGGMARAWFIGRWKIRQQSEATAAAYNLLRMARLAPTG